MRLVIWLCVLLAGGLVVACEKEAVATKLRREAAEKIIGKWSVAATHNDYYAPINTLVKSEEQPGTVNDYYDFKKEELVEVNSTSGTRTESYHVWNPYQVMIGDTSWWIRKLTANEMVLEVDWYYAADNRRFFGRRSLKR